MSKYDFACRLKRIVHEECKMSNTEANIAQKSLKYYEQISSLNTMLINQEQELAKYRKEVNKLVLENDKLVSLNQEMESSLCTSIQNTEVMQQRHLEQRRLALTQMDCIRSMKLATQTYFNLNALPLLQGVTIIEADSSSEWEPFFIDTSKHTQKEVSSMIWKDSQMDSVLKTTWEALIFSEKLEWKQRV